jgi:hypothetical protein
MSQINFVKDRIKSLSKLEEQDKRFFKISLYIALFLIGSLAIVLGVKLYLSSEFKNVESSRTIILQRIESQEESEKTFVLFASKLQILSDIFVKREDKQEAISYFSQVFGPDVTIGKIAYDASSQLLAFELVAADVFSLERVFDVLDNEQTQSKFADLEKGSLQRNARGHYQTQITVLMNQEELK